MQILKEKNVKTQYQYSAVTFAGDGMEEPVVSSPGEVPPPFFCRNITLEYVSQKVILL